MAIAPSPSSQTQQFLCFQLQETLAMLPTQQLTEILNLHVSQVVPIPDIASVMMGVCNWRGEVLWLVDLNYLLGFQPLYTQALRQGQVNVIIIHHQGQTLGLAVDRVEQMQWCNPNQFQPAPTSQITPALARCLVGCWANSNGSVALVLDGVRVMDYLRN